MKKILRLLPIFILIILVSGCGSSNITEISYTELEKKLELEKKSNYVVGD